MGKSKALAKSTASGFSLDYSCALSVRKGKSKAKVRHSRKGDAK